MKQKSGIGALCAIMFFACLYPYAGACAGEAPGLNGSNYNALVLTPGHSQTILFELGNIVFNDYGEFHSCYIVTLGEGTVNVRVGPASSVGQFAGMVYAVVGFIGVQPVVKYAYNAETISLNAAVPAVGAGLLLTAITVGIGSPDYPVIMSMVVSLLQ
ncbi:MAG: hypothetical protein WCQ99_04260 [Pseudomonadota bacterium]